MAWGLFLSPWAAIWALAALLPVAVLDRKLRTVLAVSLVVGALALFLAQAKAYPVQRLLASSLCLLYVMKGAVLLTRSRESIRSIGPASLALFSTVWPGMEPDRIRHRSGEPAEGTGRQFSSGLAIFYLGVAGVVGTALLSTRLPDAVTGWAGIASLLTAVHFGLSSVVTALMRLSGRAVEDLFDRPFASKTLSEFWSKRWNRPFVAMNRELFMPAFRKVFGTRGAVVCAFLVSGVLHELAISYPSGGGWGGPLVYFALQAALVLLERKLKVRSRLWALTAVLLPLPLLFHGPFRTVLVVPFFHFLRYLLCAHTVGWYFGWGLWVMGGLQLSVLLASFQVPAALNWKEDLAKLTPFNRKLMWVYGSFIVTTITGFGLLTLVLHQSLLKGESAAVALAAFISIFWILRILTDHFYFEDADWPKGERYVVGHALLNSLFTFLILSYGGLAVWHLAGY